MGRGLFSDMGIPLNSPLYPKLLEYRRESAKRRAIAFCDAPEYVLGTEVLPLTPATFSMLVAMNSRFLGASEPLEADARNYLWFHSRLYGHCGVPDWRKRKKRALRSFNWLLTRPWLRWVGLRVSVHDYCACLALVTGEIKTLIDDAFADAPATSGNAEKPLATLEAQLIVEFAKGLGWLPERTRHTPLRQLFQLHRCLRRARGEEIGDAGEDALHAEHIRLRNKEAQNAREAVLNGG